MSADRRLHLGDVDRVLESFDLRERDLSALAHPRPGERVITWLGRAARTADAREVAWAAIGLGLLGGTP